jgi:hypothetical protein
MTKDQWKIKRLNEARITSGARQWNSTPADGFNGAFLLVRDGRRLCCISSDQEGWEHVSVTDQTTRKSQEVCPTWDDMNFIKRAFWDDDETVMELHVPQAAWVNEHEGCLHLWKPVDREIPVPPSLMVGFQEL